MTLRSGENLIKIYFHSDTAALLLVTLWSVFCFFVCHDMSFLTHLVPAWYLATRDCLKHIGHHGDCDEESSYIIKH